MKRRVASSAWPVSPWMWDRWAWLDYSINLRAEEIKLDCWRDLNRLRKETNAAFDKQLATIRREKLYYANQGS